MLHSIITCVTGIYYVSVFYSNATEKRVNTLYIQAGDIKGGLLATTFRFFPFKGLWFPRTY